MNNELTYQSRALQDNQPAIHVLIYYHGYFFNDPMMNRLASWEHTKSVASCNDFGKMELYVKINHPEVVLMFGDCPWVVMGEGVNRIKLSYSDTSVMYLDSNIRWEQDDCFEMLKKSIRQKTNMTIGET